MLPELKNIRCPLLITWGLEDEVLPVKHAIKGYPAMPLRSSISSATVVTCRRSSRQTSSPAWCRSSWRKFLCNLFHFFASNSSSYPT